MKLGLYYNGMEDTICVQVTFDDNTIVEFTQPRSDELDLFFATCKLFSENIAAGTPHFLELQTK